MVFTYPSYIVGGKAVIGFMKCLKILPIVSVESALTVAMRSYQDISLAIAIGYPDKVIA